MVPRTVWAFELPCVAAVLKLLSAFAQFWGVPPLPYRARSPAASRSASGAVFVAGPAASGLAAGFGAGFRSVFLGWDGVTLGGGVALASSTGFSGVASFEVGPCAALVPLAVADPAAGA